jgi:DNA repair photolyase
MKIYKSALGMRGDMLYCPLPLSIDSYWTCEINCLHCYSRRLNRTWGNDFRMADVEDIKRKLSSTSKQGRSPLHKAIQLRKTLRLGNRSEPFSPWEEEYQISTQILKFLMKQEWDTVVQTKFPRRAYEMTGLGNTCTMMAVVMPGLEEDWELFECCKTETPIDRVKTLAMLKKKGFEVGVNGEPFIPGHHTVKQFKETIKLLKSHGINRYNIYNLHMNDYVVKNLHKLGLDIEKIWYMNQDKEWRKILRKLIAVANKYDIILGCPDFVNSGWEDVQRSNTCCGLDVKNPCTFNTHHFKLAIQNGRDPKDCWDGVGEYEKGLAIIEGTDETMYTMKDVVG